VIAALSIIFLLSYAAIALEHPLHVNKTATALIAAGLMWVVFALMSGLSPHEVGHEKLGHTLVEVGQIVFFLMGAMTIVELIDIHNGFDIITKRIKTLKLSTLMFQIGIATFFLSAVLDNLATTIVMCSLIKKILGNKNDRLLFAGLIVITANAGGAWSPIGDVTTTMLWVADRISALTVIYQVFIPSVIAAAVPLLVVTNSLKGKSVEPPKTSVGIARHAESTPSDRNIIFYSGIGVLVSVPIFKTVTHLPPFLGVMFGLGFLWLITDLIHKNKTSQEKDQFSLAHALSKIDMSSIVFFIGILLAVATLEHSQILPNLAKWLESTLGNTALIIAIIGIMSSLVDNVPMVAASIKMFDLGIHPKDSFLWQFLAFCAGTGGSILIIGSAAGLAAMGMEKINFIWYMKKISFLALIGYIAGAIVFIVQYQLLFT
jgi:Na+/H+ antiporter NhaD/arsenite permease-like protein